MWAKYVYQPTVEICNSNIFTGRVTDTTGYSPSSLEKLKRTHFSPSSLDISLFCSYNNFRCSICSKRERERERLCMCVCDYIFAAVKKKA
jgi:hypothetical protein